MSDPQHILSRLTEREREILSLIVEGLSNQEIAERLVLTHGTVKWYARQIYSKLGVNTRAQAMVRAESLELPTSNKPLDTLPVESRNNLPRPLTTFIGRRRVLDQIKQLLIEARLVTLTGAGGLGKTRLAIEVASKMKSQFADGVIFVNLAPVAESAQVANAIAQALDVIGNPNEPLVESLKRALKVQTLLLVIDNFEHVIQAAPLVNELLAAAPGVRMLTTSREALRLSGEQEYPVLPMGLPSGEDVSIERIKEAEAVALFLQRTRMVRPGFEMDAENAPAVVQVCIRLDGLPLAIELAAARCKTLSPQALLARFDSRLTTLTNGARDAPARQQTLRNTIEWSYNLLDEGEKILFERMAVFRGGRSLEAIEAVCGEGLSVDVFDALSGLVDKNLVYQQEGLGGEPRFLMLETIHEYARECLEMSGQAEVVRRRHAAYMIIGEIARPSGDDVRARRAYEESLAIAQQIGGIRRIQVLTWNLVYIDQHEGHHERAIEQIRTILRWARDMNNQLDMSGALHLLAPSLVATGQARLAARLWGAADAALERVSVRRDAADMPEYERCIAAMRAQLDPATYEAAYAEGRKMTLEQAVANALGESR